MYYDNDSFDTRKNCFQSRMGKWFFSWIVETIKKGIMGIPGQGYVWPYTSIWETYFYLMEGTNAKPNLSSNVLMRITFLPPPPSSDKYISIECVDLYFSLTFVTFTCKHSGAQITVPSIQ